MELRRSRQREAILQVLQETSSHPTAGWVYEQVRKEMPSISLGTVYRNLALLGSKGRVLELVFGDGLRRFDANTLPHHHFVCQGCSSVFDISLSIDRKAEEKVARQTGFTVLGQRQEFFGLCPGCQKRRG